MIRKITLFCGFLLCVGAASSAFASLPPGSPDYVLKLPEAQWVFGERLWRDQASCTPTLCEAGYHAGELLLSVDRQGDLVRIVGGFQSCEKPSWNDLDLTDTPPADRPAVVRYLTKNLIAYAAEQCGVPAPQINVPDMTPLFSATDPN